MYQEKTNPNILSTIPLQEDLNHSLLHYETLSLSGSMFDWSNILCILLLLLLLSLLLLSLLLLSLLLSLLLLLVTFGLLHSGNTGEGMIAWCSLTLTNMLTALSLTSNADFVWQLSILKFLTLHSCFRVVKAQPNLDHVSVAIDL